MLGCFSEDTREICVTLYANFSEKPGSVGQLLTYRKVENGALVVYRFQADSLV
jgi:hypothetical protein